MRTKLVEVRKSKLHGKGLFARETIPAGTQIIEFTGWEMVSATEALKREKRYKGHCWMIDLNRPDGKMLDVAKGGIAKYANHSKRPNCYMLIEDGRRSNPFVTLYSKGRIPAGRELTFDYGFDPREE